MPIALTKIFAYGACFSPYIFPSPPPCIVPSSALLPAFPGFLCVPPLTSGALEAGGFTTPCSPVQTRCRPLCVEGSPEVVAMSTVFSVGLWGTCAVSWPLGSGREQGEQENKVVRLVLEGGKSGRAASCPLRSQGKLPCLTEPSVEAQGYRTPACVDLSPRSSARWLPGTPPQ